MYKIVYNKASLLIILLVATMALGIGGGFLPLPEMPVNMILLLAVVPIFLVVAVVLYPMGDLKVFLKTTCVMLGSFVASMLVISGVSIGIAKQSISGMDLNINPVSLIIPVLMSIIIVKLFVTLQKIEPEIKKVQEVPVQEEEKPVVSSVVDSVETSTVIEEKPVEQDIPQVSQPESEMEIKEEPVKQEMVEEKLEEELYLEDMIEDKPVEQPKSLYDYTETENKEEPEPEIYLEDLVDTPVKAESKVEEEVVDTLGELPDLVEDTDETIVASDPSDEETETEETSFEYKATEDYVVPELAETPTNKLQEGGGKITSIGKLLVDHRDIENIIETNALMQSVGSDVTTTKIISAVAGSKTNEKLTTLSELEGINAAIVVNDAGFIQASTLKDVNKEQIIGAMASGTFGVISSTLSKMGFQPAKDITLKSDSESLVLHKITDNIVAVFVSPDYPVYDTEDIAQILNSSADSDVSKVLELISSVHGVIGTIISDEEGKLQTSKLIDETKNPEIIASMLPTFYSNLGVFIKNMDQGAMRKAIISTGNEIVLFTKLNKNIIMLYATPNTSILPNDLRIQYEAIINN